MHFASLCSVSLTGSRRRAVCTAQGRWNGDPYDMNGGDGCSEMDPGVFLLPYWLARYFGLIV